MTPRDEERAALFAGTYIPHEVILDDIILQEEIASMPEWRLADHGNGWVRDGKNDATERAKRSLMKARARVAALVKIRNEIDRSIDQARSNLRNATDCLAQAEKRSAGMTRASNTTSTLRLSADETANVDAADLALAQIDAALAEPDQSAEIARLRALFRVNALRWVPGITHAEIDALLDGRDHIPEAGWKEACDADA